MRARLYIPRSGDARVLDRLTGNNRNGNIDIERDRIILATGSDPVPLAFLISRRVAWVHDFYCSAGMNPRLAAIALTNFAIADALAAGVRDAIFTVDPMNAPMLRYARELGAVQQDPKIVFTLNVDGGNQRP